MKATRRIICLAAAIALGTYAMATGSSGAAEARYTQRGSTVLVVSQGRSVEITYDQPSPERRSEGVRPGDVLFTGQVEDDYAEGMAWLYDPRCGKIDYFVYGDFRPGKPFTLAGAAPVFGGGCKIVDNVYDSPEANLAFAPACNGGGGTPKPPPAAVGSLGPGSKVCPRGVASGSFLNLRVAPGSANPVVAVLREGICATLAGACQSGWCPVSSDGAFGWASADYLRPG